MSESVKLKITTLTPATIGSGSELSPYSDYVIDKNEVCFIDKKKMQDKILQKGDQFLELYIQGVATGIDNNRSNFDLKSFLINHKIVGDISEVIAFRCPFVGNQASKLPVKGLLKSPLMEPYFPGSTIKGALKTVLMYNWLKTNKKANETIERVINGGNFDFLEKQFEYREDELTHNIIRKNTIQQVTDSSCIQKENIVVVDCYRKMPIRFECIAKENTAEFELTLENYQWKKLAVQANDFAFEALGRELQILAEQGKNDTDYYSKIDELQEIINDCPKDINTAYLRIGFGKGFYLNSLGIAIYYYLVDENGNITNKNLYYKFEEFIKKQFPKSNQKGDLSLEEFPKTRLFVTNTQEPLGWVKIEKISN